MAFSEIDLQPTLQNDLVKLEPLKTEDFEKLFKVASDSLIWEQHPDYERYKREVFEIYFRGAMESKAAFLVYDSKTNTPIGSSRFYDFNFIENRIAIGFTFLARQYWGGSFNYALKKLMIDHSFKFTNTVIFHIGFKNIRSQKAIEKIGGKRVGENDMDYYSEADKLHFIYQIKKEDWIKTM